ncbi:hypothetical protein TB1_004604 [Malus domestica]
MASQILLLTTLLAITCSLVVAFEPSPLQDFCVANATSLVVRVNGLPCLDSKLATAEHFFFSGLHIPRTLQTLLVEKSPLSMWLKFQGSTPSASHSLASTTHQWVLSNPTLILVPPRF